MLWVLILGLLMNAVVLPLAARRVLFLYRAITLGQPAPDRVKGVTGRIFTATKRQVVEVFGQKKLLKWSVPGAAHFFVFWAFVILGSVYVEAYGSLLKLLFTGGDGHMDWAIPLIGHWALLGFAQDFIAVMALFGLVTFYVIRLRNAPKDHGRKSRFFGSHLGPAYLTLFMIFNVIWTMFLFRGASSALGNLPYESGAFVSIGVGNLLGGLSEGVLEVLEGIGLLLHIGVMLAFLLFVLNSKHLHIFLAPLNVLFGREPKALGAAKPMMSGGKALTLEDLEDLDEDAKLGVGAAEDFSWKGILDFATCTECGRCQDQCPAWNTEKPLSPKLMIMALRDHTMSKAPYLLADEDKRDGLAEGSEKLAREVERPLVGDTGDDWFYMPDSGAAVIDPDVLWSCVTCGACVEQCPVDIEHVDHIVDMRRYQVLIESNFPSELNGLFKGLENKGNPWNMSPTARMDWAKDLPFEVKVVGEDIESLDEVDWLFWVGCAGAYEDRAKKTTRAVAELLDMAGVSFAVLGNGETCNGDSARRAGNEFVFQGLAAQNIETFKEYKVKKVVSTCAHCFNTLKNEYRQLGIELEVVHHTQLLNWLVREKKLTPVRTSPDRSWKGPHLRSITYHDPCYIGRHNGVYSPPRELLSVIPDTQFTEMPRNSERSFCCGAGGARMWMEETIGSRINETRTAEAVATGADQIAVGCPFCRVMLSDGLTAAQSKGEAREEVEVLDVAQMLLASVKGETTPAGKKAAASSGAKAAEAKAGGAAAGGATATATIEREDEATKAEPEAGDVTQSDETVTDTEDVGPAAKASGGSSLFDLGDDSGSEDAESEDAEAKVEPEAKAETGGGSLFDVGGDSAEEKTEDKAAETAEAESKAEEKSGPAADEKAEPVEKAESADEGFGGGSLFDVGGDDTTEEATEPKTEDTGDTVDRSQDDADTDVEPEEDQAEPEPKAEEKSEPKAETSSSGVGATPSSEIPEGGSLFDIEAPAEEQVSAPAADESDEAAEPAESDEASDEPEDKGEDAAADSTTDDLVDRSQDDADTDVEPEEDQAEPEAEADESQQPGDESTDKSSITSLRDIKAKYADGGPGTGDDADAQTAEPETNEPSDEDSEEEPTEEPADEADSDEVEEAEETDDAGKDEAEEQEKPKPVSSGDSHRPRTDAEIGEGGSLFDI